MEAMKQLGLGLNLSTKKTRKREFLEAIERVVPWAALVKVVEPHYPKARTGRPPFGIETKLRLHYLQRWFGLSDPAMEEALHDIPMYREFAKLEGVKARLPDETTILRLRNLLEKHELAADLLGMVNDILQSKGLTMKKGTVVDASVRAKVEHPFRVLKRQFGYTKVRYRGLAKKTAQIQALRSMLYRPFLGRRAERGYPR
jgi:IS5 family transposase